MKTIIDTGRKHTNGVWKDTPNPVLDARRGRDGWYVNAQPSTYGSYAGGGVTHNLAEAMLPAIRFLLDHGESKELIVSTIFADERAALAQALFGWLCFNTFDPATLYWDGFQAEFCCK